MNDQVEDLMKRAKSSARKYKSLSRKHTQLIDQSARTDWNAPERDQLERQRTAIVAEMAALSGPL
jgi:hypothetical protein